MRPAIGGGSGVRGGRHSDPIQDLSGHSDRPAQGRHRL